jgi:hypothetical protein
LPHRQKEANQVDKKRRAKKKKEQARKSRKRAVNRNRKFVENYKIQNPCPCGETESCALSFHHNNGDKMGNVSDMVNRGYGIKRLRSEVSKCNVLCLNCHAKLHNKERNNL